MKRVILALLITITGISAGDWYVGAGFATGTSERTISGSSATVTNDFSGLDAKFGYIFESNNRIEISKSTHSVDTVDYDGTDFNWVWTVDYHDMYVPFFTLGFGSHSVKTSTTTLDGSSINGGLGLFVIFDTFEVELSVKSQNIGYNVSSIGVTEAMTRSYIGAKYLF